MILFENCRLYAPDDMGRRDVLVAGGKIAAIGAGLKPPSKWPIETVDCAGLEMIPGIIDGHVHFAGAGGEGGPATRTPELQLSGFLEGGVTTAVGCLGTDGITRTVESLLMKAKGLKQEGLSCWIYTGSYQVPTPTIVGEVAKDLCYVEEVIGAGEIAIADHRSSSPTVTELVKLAKTARVGGLLSGKAGILHMHMGDGHQPFERIDRAVATSELSYDQFYPTHVNRNQHIFEDAKTYGKRGSMDITTSSYPFFAHEEVKPSEAVVGLLEAGVPLAHITMSSDAGGSLPAFDAAGRLLRVDIGRSSSILNEIRDLVSSEGLPLDQAIRTVTANPARILKLASKGEIVLGKDADLVLIDRDFRVRHVLANGCWMVRDSEAVRKGNYEDALARCSSPEDPAGETTR